MTRRNHTPIRLVNQITNLPRYLLPGGSASAKFRIHRVGELLERRKMKVGLGQLLGFRRAAEAFLPLPPFDPAGLVSELRSNADVMMLALRDMKDIRLAIAGCRLPAQIEGEERRIWLGISGFVASDAIVERIAERIGVS